MVSTPNRRRHTSTSMRIALGACMAVVSLAATAGAAPVSDARFAQLERGINLSHWFAQVRGATGYTPEHLLRHTTVDDVALIKRLGFRHVRLNIDPLPMMNADAAGIVRGAHLAQLDRAVRMFVAADLAVIMDVHPHHDFKRALERDDRVVERFAEFWRDLASHFAGVDPERLFYGVLNEPEFEDGYRWSGVQAKLVATIRQAAGHTVIVTGRRWSAVDDLLALEPVADGNVVYNFHFYAPSVFTHQGAAWGSAFWRHLAHSRRRCQATFLGYGCFDTDTSGGAHPASPWRSRRWQPGPRSTMSGLRATSSGCTVRWPIRPIARRGSPTCVSPWSDIESAGRCGTTRATSVSSPGRRAAVLSTPRSSRLSACSQPLRPKSRLRVHRLAGKVLHCVNERLG